MRRLRIVALLAVASSFSTVAMDFFAPSIPGATRGLATSADGMRAAIVLFLLGYGLSPFLWGVLADRFGRRPVMIAGIACYTLASLGCMLSPGIGAFALFRVLQGAGAACTAIIARTVLRDVHGAGGATQAIAGMFLIMVWVPITAPFIGGLMSAWFDWRVMFAVMSAVAGATLLACLAWIRETRPESPPTHHGVGRRWREVIGHPVFLRHTLANMFCYTAMLYTLANYSYITEAGYGFTPGQNGLLLTVFNTAVSAGFYLVWLTVPRIGIDNSIRTGLWMGVLGWTGFLLATFLAAPPPVPMAVCVLIGCLGTGMVVSLSVGQALVPFTHAAGTASALFILVQSTAASILNFAAGALFETSLTVLAAFLTGCAVLAVVTTSLISRRPGRGPDQSADRA